MRDIAKGKTGVHTLYVFYSWHQKAYPPESMRMTFVSNHDHNSWEGTQFEQFGDALEAAIVLSVVGEGMPLIYNGQEAGNPKRLEFFEKDPIEWREHPIGDLYKNLFALKKENTALWNGQWGATMIKVPNDLEGKVLSFVRQNDRDKVFAVLNFTDEAQTATFKESLYHEAYTDYFSGESVEWDESSQLEIEPWGYQVFVKAKAQ